MGAYRVAVEPTDHQHCAFNTSPICARPGLVGEMTLFTLRLLLDDVNATFLLQPAEGFQYKNEVPRSLGTLVRSRRGAQSWGAGDGSVMGQVMRGAADFSEADMYLQENRATRVPHLGALLSVQHEILYPRVNVDAPSLNADAITSWKLYAIVFGLAIAFHAVQLSLESTPYWSIIWVRKFSSRYQVVFGIFLACFLKFLSSDIVLILNRMTPDPTKFRSAMDVIEALESGEYTAITLYKATFDTLLNPVSYAHKSSVMKRLVAVHAYNPHLLIRDLDIAMQDFILRPKDGRKYVLFVDTVVLARVRANYCGFSVVPQQGDALPLQWYTVYHRHGLVFPRRKRHYSGELRWRWAKTVDSYHLLRACNAANFDGRTREQHRLSLAQIQIVFWLILSGCGAGIFVAIIELKLAWLSRFFGRKELPGKTSKGAAVDPTSSTNPHYRWTSSFS